MVVDYSKWDKLELSDDSDIEVHPNVDKNSFIRWKQRDIHEKREQAKFRMLQLEVNIETNHDLLKRVNKLIAAGEDGRKVGLNVESDVEFSQAGETKEKPAKATSPEQPRYTDMIESMLMQIVAEGGDHTVVLNKLKEHREMIENALKAEGAELDKLEDERKQHITADDIRTGWDSTIVYKPSSKSADADSGDAPTSSAASEGSAGSGIKSSTTVETLNSPKSPPKPKMTEDGLEELLPATQEFGELPIGDMENAYKYMMQHPYIVTEGQKDALMMSAFEHELANDSERARRVVWNSLLIQYSNTLGKNGVQLFFSKIVQKTHPAREAFEKDAETTFNHIKTRCKILREDHARDDANADGEETIQLHAVDPETELVIRIPEKDSEGYAIYETLSPEMQAAVTTCELDRINEVLGSLRVDEAEAVVEKLSESGVLQVESKIYDPEEWEQKRKELEVSEPSIEGLSTEERTEDVRNTGVSDDTPVPSTIDDVD